MTHISVKSTCLTKSFLFIVLFTDYQFIHPIVLEYPTSSMHTSQRHRRSLDNLREDLLLSFTAFNQTFQLHLRRNNHFLAGNSKIQYRHGNTSSSSENIGGNCYFRGKISSVRGKAAVSLCDGMVSRDCVIFLKNTNFWYVRAFCSCITKKSFSPVSSFISLVFHFSEGNSSHSEFHWQYKIVSTREYLKNKNAL